MKSTLSGVKSLQVHKYLVGSIALETTLRKQNASRLLNLLEKSPSDLIVPQRAAGIWLDSLLLLLTTNVIFAFPGRVPVIIGLQFF